MQVNQRISYEVLFKDKRLERKSILKYVMRALALLQLVKHLPHAVSNLSSKNPITST